MQKRMLKKEQRKSRRKSNEQEEEDEVSMGLSEALTELKRFAKKPSIQINESVVDNEILKKRYEDTLWIAKVGFNLEVSVFDL